MRSSLTALGTVCLVLLLLLLAVFSWGQNTVHVVALDRSQLTAATLPILEITDPTYWQNNGGNVLEYRSNIRLIYGREDRSDVAIGGPVNPWWFRVQYQLYDDNYNLPFGTGTLEISHETVGGTYESFQQYAINRGQVTLQITGLEASEDNFQTTITDPQQIATIVPADVRLELQMDVNHYEELDDSVPLLVYSNYDSQQHQLDLTWSFIPGVQYYEVEWWYLDGTTIDFNNHQVSSEDFKGAVRVEVKGQKYTISTTYPYGKLFYRIRPVGRFITGVTGNNYELPKYGDWSDTQELTLVAFEANHNWQYTTTFAEEGKYKKVISYFDDGLKNRQTQTNLSTDNITLVATSHYDVEGRPTLNVLPVPALGNNDLFYKAKFNRATPSTGPDIAYNRIHFDKSGSDCITSAEPLSEGLDQGLGGAAHYFSSQRMSNPNNPGIHQAYVPDAEGYPMTQVRFKNDGTGRIVAQGGVGAFYQLGSGQETKYFYDDASEYQLRRLFGSNVGAARYYKRNLVRDANGQLSVSYLDAAGRVVATALAGPTPENTIGLGTGGNPPAAINITENLMDNNVISVDQKLSYCQTQLVNEEEGTRATFTYDLNGINQTLQFNGNDYCTTCDYILRIRVYDPCGIPAELLARGGLHSLHSQLGSDPRYGNSSAILIERIIDGPFANGPGICESTTYTVFDPLLEFDVIMAQEGTYTVIKELIVVDPSIEDHLAYLTLPPPAPGTLDDLSCRVSCVECGPGNLPPPGGQGGSSNCSENVPFMIEVCDTLIGSIFSQVGESCNSLYYEILHQVSPEGCLYERAGGPWWQGLIDNLSFEYNGATAMGSDAGLQMALQDPAQWQDSWGVILAMVHPEYCRYVLCRNSVASREFDLRLSQAQTWKELDNSLPDNTDFGSGTGVDLNTLLMVDPMLDVTASNATTPGGFYPNYENALQHIPIPADYLGDITNALSAVLGTSSDPDAQEIADALETKLSNALNSYGTTNMDVISYIYDEFDDNDLSNSGLGEVGDLDGNGTANEPADKQFFRFQIFKALYLGEKERLRQELRTHWCPLPLPPNDDCKISTESELFEIPFPTGNGDNSINEAEAQIDAAIADNCTAACFANIDSWMNTIQNEMDCTGLNYTTIEFNLEAYCNGACGVSNPMGFLLYENDASELLNDAHLLAVYNTMLAGSNGIDCWATFVATYGKKFEDVYQEVLVDGNPVTYNGEPVVMLKPLEETVNLQDYYDWCKDQLIVENLYKQYQIWQWQVDELLTAFIQERDCLEEDQETFYVEYQTREYHYTLYYYDQAGNLVQTVPPAGVMPLANTAFTNGEWNGTVEPAHQQITKYQYNTLGQVITQYSPDGGQTQFKYDYAQRLRFSQNAKQAPEVPTNELEPQEYSFSSYDAQGRIVKVGELREVAVKFGNLNDTHLNSFDFPTTNDGAYTDVVYTEYNKSTTPDNTFAQDNLRGRVSLTRNDHQETRYSYDEHGNVKALQHQVAALDNNHKIQLTYDYDLISGNVQEVAYQAGQVDQFYHRYEYDADNRLTRVHSSDDGLLWEEDASYFYYQHGPLARVELGEDKIQGLDYYYTLQGWIKGVNLPDLPEAEPGSDAKQSNDNEHRYFPQDEMAYILGYHRLDYRAIDPTVQNGPLATNFWDDFSYHVLPEDPNATTELKGFYNGNIAAMFTDIPELGNSSPHAMNVMAYRYDQLHRLQTATSFYKDGEQTVNNQIQYSLTEDNRYGSDYSYDPNGNLDHLNRFALDNNGAISKIDQLSYVYDTPNGLPNRLIQVTDTPTGDFSGNDHSLQNQPANNYRYDAIGNLIGDVQENVSEIKWNVFGKVASVHFTDNRKTSYTYDPAGNRLSKTQHPVPGGGASLTTFYLRDASGNVLSLYEKDEGTGKIDQKEVSLYGSSRVGLQKFFDRDLSTMAPVQQARQRGEKYFELSNHLGNVLAVVNDYKFMVDVDSDGTYDRYVASVESAVDYRPFGEAMRGRNYNSPNYRYGFNGKEKDQSGEWSSQTHYDYGFRIYNPEIARFLSVDPLTREYPELTPYQFASNTPIQAIDLDGLEAFFIHGTRHGPEAWDTELSTQTADALFELTNNSDTERTNDFSWKVKSQQFKEINVHQNFLPPTKTRRMPNFLNYQFNTQSDRREAAFLLVDYIINFRKENSITHKEISLIGYSHGGNVAIQAAQILKDKYGLEVNIIAINTPADSREESIENPANNTGINDMILFYTEGDNVTGTGLTSGRDRQYTVEPEDFEIQQYEIESNDEIGGPLNNHYIENINPEEIRGSGAEKLKPIGEN